MERNYFKQLNPLIKQYFNVLSQEIPDFLVDYIHTPEMLRLNDISLNCGTDYTKLYNIPLFYSTLDHSVGVALIIWHFTHDKKQTIAGLFHDIATPVFKHCIDFVNGDYLIQESTEELTETLIRNSKSIMTLLNRDGIKVEEVMDYKIYPIADNPSPKLSADRLEYHFSAGLSFFPIWQIDVIKQCYQHLYIAKNEDGENEIAFDDLKMAKVYMKKVSKLWPKWIENKDKLVMEFIADTIKKMLSLKLLTMEDLYHLTETEVIDLIEQAPKTISYYFKCFKEANSIIESDVPLAYDYGISFETKRRYIIPLVNVNHQVRRVNQQIIEVEHIIQDYLNYKQPKYAYFDFKYI